MKKLAGSRKRHSGAKKNRSPESCNASPLTIKFDASSSLRPPWRLCRLLPTEGRKRCSSGHVAPLATHSLPRNSC